MSNTTHYFTSITTCYLPKARVLAKTLKYNNPSAIMHLVIADDLPSSFRLEEEPFDYVWYPEQFINIENREQWFYIHSVVELCTAIKASATLHIMKVTNAKNVIYLDPDIGVFDSLDSLEEMLENYSVLLTPHQTNPAKSKSTIISDELCSLKHGVYNFGFFAVANDTDGHEFLNWWHYRLMHFCFDDIPNGMFTDQKWGDIAPALFPFVKIIHDETYNVATWNLENRKISKNDDIWLVNGKRLKFYHFSGFDSGAHRAMLRNYANEGDPVWELSTQYEKMLNENGQALLGKSPCKYNIYASGNRIENCHRSIFKARIDLQNFFINPYSIDCEKWMIKYFKEVNNFESIQSCYINLIKYKLKYKITFGERRKKNKSLYTYYKKKIIEYNEIVEKQLSNIK